MRKLFLLLTFGAALWGCASMPMADRHSDAGDPHLWLEEVHGEKALAWVKSENAKSQAQLEGDRRYASYRKEALAIFTSQDRIVLPEFRANGIDNFWQDDTHPHGVWRHSDLASYRAKRPRWQVLLELDALSKSEGKNWFFKGADCLAPDDRLCLVYLSDGGGDAVEIREFDTIERKFVVEGFRFERTKQNVDWIDRDRVAFTRPTTADDTTESGYPFVLRVAKRGMGSSAGEVVFRGEQKDTMVYGRVLRDSDGTFRALIAERRVSFFEVEQYLIQGASSRRIELPTHASFRVFTDGQMIYTLQRPWKDFKAGALISIDLKTLDSNPAAPEKSAQLVFQPDETQTIDAVQSTKNSVIVQLLENVQGALDVYTRRGDAWSKKRLSAFPRQSQLIVRAAQKSGSQILVTSEGFLSPTQMWWADVDTAGSRVVQSLPARFSAKTHKVSQVWATSKDGTKIPYFLVLPKRAKLDGTTPTLLFGYGGFLLSKPPAYLPEMGKLWLERGGAYVIANIRGGGEFGPRWHQAALREHRQRAFDDFAAVAEDLIARKVSSTRRLGIYGRSNGGVLTTVSMTQRPELFRAVVVESPLVDMLRYHKLSAGASWVAEYGNPDVASDRAFIEAYSAYQKLRPGQAYPLAYITTNTEDDRVHPGHARKFAARLSELGVPYLYFENTFGGHSNDADPTANAERWARHYVYLAQRLMD